MAKKQEEKVSSPEGATKVPIAKISLDPPYQPRQNYRQERVEELADSIKTHGLLEAVTVRPLLEEERDGQHEYEVVAGKYRMLAHIHLKKESIPANIRSMTRAQAREIALIENIQRENLTIMEEAQGLYDLGQELGDVNQVAERVGKSLPYLYERIALLNLPLSIQQMLDKGEINLSHAKAILQFEDKEVQVKAAKLAAKLQLSANELKARMQREAKGRQGSSGTHGVVTQNQLSANLARVYEVVEAYEFDRVSVEKRFALRNQISLLLRALEDAVKKLAPPEEEGEEEVAELED